jgi:hypothetical protein
MGCPPSRIGVTTRVRVKIWRLMARTGVCGPACFRRAAVSSLLLDVADDQFDVAQVTFRLGQGGLSWPPVVWRPRSTRDPPGRVAR